MTRKKTDSPPAQTGELLPAGTSQIAEYSATERGLAALRASAVGPFDVTQKADMAKAREVRATCVSLRTGLDKARKMLNEDDQARIKARNELAKKIEGEIRLIEAPIDEAILAEERRKEAEKAERDRLEAARVAAIRARIDAISLAAITPAKATADELQALLVHLETEDLTDMDEVYLPEAEEARDVSIAAVKVALARRLELDEQEAELARRKAQQDELDRQAKERRDAEDRARREAQDKEDAERRERLRLEDEARAAELKTLAAQRDAVAAEAKKIADAKAAEEQKAKAEADRIAAEEREAQRLRDEKADKDRRAAADKKLQAEIAAATLPEAAHLALNLLTELGHAGHITTMKLASALAKEIA